MKEKCISTFRKPRFRTKILERSVSVYGPNIWKKMDKEIKDTKTIAAFKSVFKGEMLEIILEIICKKNNFIKVSSECHWT